jgi:hypothetical protein
MTDAVEKVRSRQLRRNNRIKTGSVVNRCCVFSSSLESILSEKVSKILFKQHRPEADLGGPNRPW